MEFLNGCSASSSVCGSTEHLIQLAVCGALALVHMAIGGALALGDVTPNPVSRHALATAHSSTPVKAWALRTLIVLSANLLTGFWKLQGCMMLIAVGWLTYVHVRWVRKHIHKQYMRLHSHTTRALVANVMCVNNISPDS
jgi:hypothetical protein